MTFVSKSGVSITFQGPIVVPAINPPEATTTGAAVNAGSNGNIPAFDLLQYCCAPNNQIQVRNPVAFTGGQDAQPDDKVQQSDIDQAAQSLIATQTQQEQAALASQVPSNEQAIKSTEQCQPNVASDAPVGTQAKKVTVSVSVTCTEEVYDPSAARTLATTRLSENSPPGYQLSGQVTVSVLSVTSTNNGTQTTIQIHAQGQWVYIFSQTRLNQLATLIAGKSQTDASALLRQQAGVADVRISSPNPLPSSANRIQMKVQQKTEPNKY